MGRQSAAPIPKVFHRIWIGGTEPRWLRPMADTWTRHHPGWELCQWDDATIERDLFPLHNQQLWDTAGTLFPRHTWQFRADVVRYEILYRYGGIYVDADLECRRPLSELLAGVEAFAAWQDHRLVNNAIVGAFAQHPFLWRLIEGLSGHVRRSQATRPAQASGPVWITEQYRRHGTGVVIFPARYFYPYRFDQLDRTHQDFPDAYARHWWRNRRRERGLLDDDGELR